MKNITTTLIIALVWCCGLSAYAQTTTTAGKEFYITYLHNLEGNNLLLKVVVEKPCFITAKYNEPVLTGTYWNGWDGTALIQPGIYTEPVSAHSVINHHFNPISIAGGIISAKTITLTSTENVCVYAINHAVVSTDATCILPVTAWGTEYRLATGSSDGWPWGFSHLVAVVAKENGTVVTLNGTTIGNITVTLNKNQVYHYRESYNTDMMGLKVTATRPVAVFSGSNRSLGPGQEDANYGCPPSSFVNSSADHTYEQLWSINKWGKDFVIFPISTPGSNGNWGGMLVIIPDQSGTVVTLTGGISGTYDLDLIAGIGTELWKPICSPMTGITKINSNKPVMVFLMLPDATVTTIHPIDQRTTRTLVSPFVVSGYTYITHHAIDLLVPAASWNQTVIKEEGLVVLDNTYTDGTYSIIDTYDGWHHVRKDWNSTQYPAEEINITCPGGFQAYVSGSGFAESYAFSVAVMQTADTVRGTVFPFVHTNDPTFNALFPITAELHELPPPGNMIGTIRLKTLLVQSTTAMLYDQYIYIPDTPKFPGNVMGTNQPGIPIKWSIIHKSQNGSTNYTSVGVGEVPANDGNNHVGFFTFKDLPLGATYVLALSRPGYMTRYAKVTVTTDGLLGHRFLIPGDVNMNGQIDSQDGSLLNARIGSMYTDPTYQARFDLNASGLVDQTDHDIYTFYINSIMDMYTDTKDWLDGK